MNDLPVLVCDKNQFHRIYQDINLLGSSEHEILTLQENPADKCYYPATKKKKLLDIISTDHNIISFTLTFFEKNLSRFVNESEPHSLLLKLYPFINDEKGKNRFHSLLMDLFKRLEIKSKEEHRTLMIEEGNSYKNDINNWAKNKIEQVDQYEQQSKQRIEILEKLIDLLKNTLVSLEDTLIVCQNTTINYHKQKLKKITFFNVCFEHPEMKKNHLSIEEKKHYQFKFDLSDFQSKTVISLLDWIENPSTLHSVTEFNSLYDVYRLADFVNDAAFRADCLKQICIKMSSENKLQILTFEDYSSSDDLISECCKGVASEFKTFSKQPLFLQIKPEYFLRIIKDYVVFLDTPEEGISSILAWAEATGKSLNKKTSEILYEKIENHRIIDYIPFGSLSKTTFTSTILPLKILSSEDTVRWLEFHINDLHIPLKKFSLFRLKKKDDHTFKISWNMPKGLFSKIGDWPHHDQMFIKDFDIDGTQYAIKMGKTEEDVMCIALQIQRSTRDFDFFLQIGNNSFFSSPKNQSSTQGFKDDGINTELNFYVKGYKLNLKEFMLSKFEKYIPLKMQVFLKDTPPKSS